MKPKVFVTRAIPEAGLKLVKAHCDADIWPDELPPARPALLERVRGVDGLLCLITEQVDAEVMDAAGLQLKVISQMAVGVDNIDLQAAAARGILVGHTPGVLTEATADLAFALLLAAARRIVEAADYVRRGQWRTWGPTTLLGADLAGATLGIIGLGRIGKAVARRAAGFDLRILAHDPGCTPEAAASVNARLVSLEELLRESDFVTLHTPLTEWTRGLINRDTLRLMKPTAILINTARGPIVDQAALVEALTTGIIGAAALDVTDPEPIPPDHPLLNLPNALIVPHIGSASAWTRDQMALMAAENLIAGVQGRPLPHPVPMPPG